eukprot:CAMPEP_0178442818 /NCGR_PEP_ID=MMETSP0689_2-20121128/38440_1 /TAXON_ID=160604 /ORGANISM="Amphidinium massartii, Strain CS-259" /LENGTH=137 /DNA_ID=CAMNT_0020066535 /DNA_START=123 /DNA_END=536 /DNA_ORIENTATION=+
MILPDVRAAMVAPRRVDNESNKTTASLHKSARSLRSLLACKRRKMCSASRFNSCSLFSTSESLSKAAKFLARGLAGADSDSSLVVWLGVARLARGAAADTSLSSAFLPPGAFPSALAALFFACFAARCLETWTRRQM